MRKYAHKIDVNQVEIVNDLRKLGYSVGITSQLGSGFPDIIVASPRTGHNYLFEIKTDNAKLTQDEQLFFDTWDVIVANNIG